MDVKQSASPGSRIVAWRFAASLPAFAAAVACQSSPTLKMGTAQASGLPDDRSAAERVLDLPRTGIQRIPGAQAERPGPLNDPAAHGVQEGAAPAAQNHAPSGPRTCEAPVPAEPAAHEKA
jgi:hypothetical protein